MLKLNKQIFFYFFLRQFVTKKKEKTKALKILLLFIFLTKDTQKKKKVCKNNIGLCLHPVGEEVVTVGDGGGVGEGLEASLFFFLYLFPSLHRSVRLPCQVW